MGKKTISGTKEQANKLTFEIRALQLNDREPGVLAGPRALTACQ